MAKVLVTNHTERKIHINLPPSAKQTEPIIVPEGRTVPDGQSQKFIPGELMVEESHLGSVKDHPVIRHYFSEGHLRVPKKAQQQEQGSGDAGKGAGDGKGNGNNSNK